MRPPRRSWTGGTTSKARCARRCSPPAAGCWACSACRGSNPPSRSPEEDLRVFSLFAAQAGAVVAEVRVGADLARRGQELAALGQVATAIRARLPEDALLEHLAEGVQEVIGFERCQVWRRCRPQTPGEDGDDAWTLAAGRGFLRGARPPAAAGLRLPDTFRALRSVRLIADIADEDAETAAFMGVHGIRSGVVAPVMVRGACEAVVFADAASAGNGRFRAEMAETLELFVGHVSVAVENARLFAELEQAGREAAALEREMARTAGLAALGQLAATVAHELRNPLSSIKGAAQFLLTECAADADAAGGVDVDAETASANAAMLRDFLTIVVDEVDGLGRLTTDLLEFARPSPPRRTRCDLVAVARAEVDFLRAELERQGVTVRESYAPPAWTDLDAAQIGRALRTCC
jgi:hypothetical protein